jgi:hypothetical protein
METSVILHRTASRVIAPARRTASSGLEGVYALDDHGRWNLLKGEDPLFDNPFTLFTEWDSEEDKGFDNL